MSYAALRDATIKANIDKQIELFAAAYQCGVPTILLVPGGTCSRLHQSKERYRDGCVAPLNDFDLVWMTPHLLRRNLPRLALTPDGHDADDHVIVAADLVDNQLRSPYDEIRSYFADTLRWNFGIFAYDWRRSLNEWAGYLEYFLHGIDRRTYDVHKERPLPTTTVLGYSLGGLVATAFLHRLKCRGESPDKWLNALVTVATCYYGTSKSMQRYYKGEAALSALSLRSRREVATVIGSMPCPYSILYVDRETYERDRCGLAQSRYSLGNYPMHDEGGGPADPYDPALARRYPPWVDTQGHLMAGRDERHQITARLNDALHARLFHIRSGLVEMAVEQTWRDIDGASFNPDTDDTPLVTRRTGPGDDRVPAWAARHVHTSLEQIYDCRFARTHAQLIEHAETHQVIEHIARFRTLPAAESVIDRPLDDDRASPQDTGTFLGRIARGKITERDPAFRDPGPWHTFFDTITW